jgi:hypothetical protein
MSTTDVLTVTAELDPLNQCLVLLSLDTLAVSDLADEGNNSDTGMSTNDGDINLLGVDVLDLAEETRCAHNIESRDTEDPGVRHVVARPTSSRQRHPCSYRLRPR